MISNAPNFVDKMRRECVKTPGVIVLPESRDPRILAAAAQLLREKSFRKVILIGDRNEILEDWRRHGLPQADDVISGLMFSSQTYPDLPKKVGEHYSAYLEQKGKKSDQQMIKLQSESALAQAGELLFQGEADAVIGGAILTTADVIRAGISSVGLKNGCRTVSGSFILSRSSQNEEEIILFADSGVVIDPKPNQLADIAFASAETLRSITGLDPKVAFLSFSTAGSAHHEKVDKIREGLKIFTERHPHIPADGEMQFDAAFDQEVADRKMPKSAVAGHANVFVFPDLNSGNIGYKIAQRLGGFAAYGPILQGLAKPFSDLSRGATAEEIVVSAYINYLRR